MDSWLPIESAPKSRKPFEMFVVIAINVKPLPSGAPYTSDPYCVWRESDGSFARWPHTYPPTHWFPLPPNSKPTPNPSQIGSSLVERVQRTIHDVEFPHGDDEARAAIREVASWMTSNPDVYFPPALVFAFEQEIE